MSETLRALDKIAFDWGERCFGREHMHDAQIRTLRMLEEAIEVAQAAGLPEDLAQRQIRETYKRPAGKLPDELAGLYNTFRVLCTCLCVDPEEILIWEVRRCLSKTPEHFAQRNLEKLSLGLAPSTTNPIAAAIASGRAPTMGEVADVVGKGERP